MDQSSTGNSWRVEYQCPQCGAPANLDEGALFFQCSFCKTKLFFSSKNYFRYYLPPIRIFDGELFYVPYWRIKGTLFSCHEQEVNNRLLDTTVLASPVYGADASLGLKPRTLPLRFVHPGVKGSFIEPSLPLAKAVERMERRLVEAGIPMRQKDTLFQSFLGDRVSVIFNPVFLENGRFCDGVTGDAALSGLDTQWPGSGKTVNEKESMMNVLAALCPECGWDLSGESVSSVLFCHHCGLGWQSSGTGFQTVALLSEERGDAYRTYLPFWRFHAKVRGVELGSHGDLVRFANLPKVPRKEWEDWPLTLWFPAFRVRADLLVRLGKLMTLKGPDRSLSDELPKTGVYPVTLPLDEAVESLKILIAELAAVKKKVFPLLPRTEISVDSSHLVLIPFKDQGEEIVDPDSRISIRKNALFYGINL